MPLPAYGALGHAFLASRILQILTLLVTIGLTAHCVSALVNGSIDVPGRLIGSLTIACLGTIYAIFSIVLYIDSALPPLLCAICDGCFLFAFIALAILFGENVSNLACRPSDLHIPTPDNTDILISRGLGKGHFNGQAGIISRIMRVKRDVTDVTAAPQASTQSTYVSLKDVSFGQWVRSSQRGCQMMKGSWAVGLVVVVLFAVSMVSLVGLWRGLRLQRKEERRNRESKVEDNIQWAT